MVYNCKVIDYGDTLHVQVYSQGIKRNDEEKPKDKLKEDIIDDTDYEQTSMFERTQEEEERCQKVSANRSKNNLYRIARSNNWDYFITLTFDRNKVDSTDYIECQKKVKVYFNNLKKRGNPDIKYLIVPELHKDGKHYHFHGLVANCPNIKLVDSGHKDNNKNIIYNIDSWSFGFTTATKIKDTARVSSYIGKYITKDLCNSTKGQHRYYASKNCSICPEEYYHIDYRDLLDYFGDDILYMKSTTNPYTGQIVKYLEINNIVKEK